MCGIAALFQSANAAVPKVERSVFDDHLRHLAARGPDDQKSIHPMNAAFQVECYLGFTRLRINDLSDRGMQPMSDALADISQGDAAAAATLYMICNGEIYNHKILKQKYRLHCYSGSDCEVIWRLYKHFESDIVKVVQTLEGEFAFVLVDMENHRAFACRDRYGVRPLFICSDQENEFASSTLGFVSELKGMSYMKHGRQAVPGVVYELDLNTYSLRTTLFHDMNKISIDLVGMQDEEYYCEKIRDALTTAVGKRVDNSDQDVCCLLSGGVDSSLVAALASQHMKKNNARKPLETFSIGIKGSPDLHYAELVARHINSKHHSIELTEHEFLSGIEETIRIIESYDTTSVRASVGNYLIAKYIKQHTNNKVVLCGDYSDEITGGYRYFKNAPNDIDFDNECRRLLNQIHYFDSLRSDRTISSQGLEVRVPYSDPLFVESYLSVPPAMRMSTSSRIEKFLLRKAFDVEVRTSNTADQNVKTLLPREVLWRKKEAFSDGVTDETRSWHMIIKEHVDLMITDQDFRVQSEQYVHNKPMLKETYYYRKIFDKYYSQFHTVVPYYWLPKWCGDQTDPSARELN